MDGTNIPPRNNPNQLNDNLDKTLDESAFTDPSQYRQAAKQQTGVSPAGAQKPYQQTQLPDGKTPIQVGSGSIVGVLGIGGMAKVYKIWNEKLEVYRAVKILLPSDQQNELANRFETEAKITAKLHHPNIVEIYNVGEWRGLPYLEMELIDGIALDALIGKYGRLPDSVCSAIGIQIAKALTYAHSQEFLLYGKNYKGIIHRDLKPANIILSMQGDLKLMDFGIARPTEAGLHTMDGHIVGTLQYLSPEQLDGVEIDKRSDIYSFGAILYEALTGTKTFPQGTITNLMKMKATNAYRKFSDLNFQTNSFLAKITEKCLQIDRSERYFDADDLHADLLKSHNSITADSPREVLQSYIQGPENYTVVNKSRKKMPVKLLSVIGGIAALIGVIVLLVILFTDEKPEDVSTGKEHIQTTKPVSKTPPVQKTRPDTIQKVVQTIPERKPERKKPAVKKQPVKERPKKTYTTPAQPVKKPPKKLSPLKKLEEKYGLDTPLDIGIAACDKLRFTDAVTALEAASGNSPKKSLYLLWAYVETKKFSKARSMATSFQSSDAFVELLKGRIQAAAGKSRSALNHYEVALTKPSAIKKRYLIRNDALYYTALVHDEHHRISPSSESRLQAMTAWNNLKKVYNASPNHPRFKLANKKLAKSF